MVYLRARWRWTLEVDPAVTHRKEGFVEEEKEGKVVKALMFRFLGEDDRIAASSEAVFCRVWCASELPSCILRSSVQALHPMF